MRWLPKRFPEWKWNVQAQGTPIVATWLQEGCPIGRSPFLLPPYKWPRNWSPDRSMFLDLLLGRWSSQIGAGWPLLGGIRPNPNTFSAALNETRSRVNFLDCASNLDDSFRLAHPLNPVLQRSKGSRQGHFRVLAGSRLGSFLCPLFQWGFSKRGCSLGHRQPLSLLWHLPSCDTCLCFRFQHRDGDGWQSSRIEVHPSGWTTTSSQQRSLQEPPVRSTHPHWETELSHGLSTDG